MGKHKGKSFEEIAQDDVDYCRMVTGLRSEGGRVRGAFFFGFVRMVLGMMKMMFCSGFFVFSFHILLEAQLVSEDRLYHMAQRFVSWSQTF